MSGSKRYVLDANVFIEAENKFYGFDLCPGYWRALITQHENGRLCSIDKVLDELTGEGDRLSAWARDAVPDSFFKKTQDQAVIKAFQAMVGWVNSAAQFTPAAKSEFAAAADGWVIAFAQVNGWIVVTHEEYAPAVQRKVPIPNVCVEFNVDYVNTFEMLKDLRVRFILSTKRRGGK
jgi:hypothetical protein